MSRGLAFQFVHTWSKLISGTESVGPFYSNWRSYSGFIANEHRPHVIAINYTYDVPKLSSRLGLDHAIFRQILDGWSLAHLINIYSGRPLTPSFGLQYADNTQGVANVNSIFTGSPDIGPRLIPTANPNNGLTEMAHMFDLTTFRLPDIGTNGTGSRNYLWSRGTFSNDINISKTFFIREGMGLELRASLFNPFNQVRRQDMNTGFTYKMRGKTIADGYYLYNSPELQVKNLLDRLPNSNIAEQYNQYRSGVGHEDVTGVMDMRRIEIGLRFKF
jgi:hypothetical protein